MKENQTYRRRAVACLLASCVVAPSAAFAQQVSKSGPPASDTNAIEEIVVTATKRAQNLQDVPAAVSVISGAAADQFNTRTLTELTRLDPALQISSNGVGDNNIIMRGIKSTGAATVALYFDEAVVTGYNRENPINGRAPDLGTYDIERVELLKGPQGTLFGAGSMAGAVRIIPNKPVMNEVSGNATAGISGGSGSNPLYEANGFVNVPILEDKVAARVVGWYQHGGGYIDDTSSGQKNVNDEEVKGVRASILLKPIDDLTVTILGLHQDINVDGTQRYKLQSGDYQNPTTTLEPHQETSYLGSIVLDYNLGIGDIIGTSSFFDREINEDIDTSPTAHNVGIAGNWDTSKFQSRSVWSNELRFASHLDGPIQLVAGAFDEEDKNYYNLAVINTPLNGLPPCISKSDCDTKGLGSTVISARDVNSPVSQWAIFGQVVWKILPELTATAGARYYQANQSDLERTLQKLRFPTSAIQGAPTVAVNSTDTESSPSYNFALAYEPSRSTTVYARAASGFRIGGLNNVSTASHFGVTIPASYNSDSLWSYETGVKGGLFGRLLSYDVAGYHINWNGQQVPAYSSNGAFTYIVNAGTSEVNGVEAQVTLRPLTGLKLFGGISYTDSHLTEDQPVAAANAANRGFAGDRTPYVPRWTAAAQVRYDEPLNATWSGYISTIMNYRSIANTNFNPNTSNFYRMPSYFLADLVGGVYTVDGLDISATVSNLTNKAAQVSIEVTADGFRVFAPRPRTYGLRVSKNF